MRFRLLGAVEADHEGRSVDLGHARQRTALTALLVDANQVVSTDQLVDRIWGDDPPQRGRGVLYAYLSRLRRAVTPMGVRIVRRDGGYVIDVDCTVVDLHRFRQLVARAHAASEEEQALQLLTEALGLWHGEAFMGLDTPWLTTVRAALNQERHVAQLEHADIALRRGKHTELLTDLSERAAQYPLDERVAGQLMLALYRNGRQAEALKHYEHTRRRLAEEVGTDPGRPLRTLHGRILTADPGLMASNPGPTPRQLPAAPSLFTGRARELVTIDGALRDGDGAEKVVVISAIGGAAGIGKTWLALHWAHENAGRFPDGQLYVNLRGFGPWNRPLPPEAALRGFLDALATDPASIPVEPEAQAALYRSLVADKRMLIVLDNAADTAQVAPLLPGGSHCAVLVTSRRRLTGLVTRYGAIALTLDVLAPGEARQLLRRHIGAHATSAEPRAVGELLDHCAGLPLALGIVATRAAMHRDLPLGMLAEELRQDATRLDALDAGELEANLRAVFSWSYRVLTPQAARLFRLLGLHPGPDISWSAAASLTGLPTDQIRAPMAELAGAHLVTEHLPSRFALHDLLRLYAREQAHAFDSDVERHRALRRVLDHYLHTAHSASQLTSCQHEIGLAAASEGVTPGATGEPSRSRGLVHRRTRGTDRDRTSRLRRGPQYSHLAAGLDPGHVPRTTEPLARGCRRAHHRPEHSAASQ